MKIDFADSENCSINGQNLIYMRETVSLLKHIEDTIAKVGPEKFFSSPDDDVKKVRESMAALFLLLAIQNKGGDSLFVMQPQNDPPDFILVKIGEKLEDMTLDPVELVEIPPRCKTFEEFFLIITKKIKKGYSQSYHLLVFINNVNSKQWLPRLNKELLSFSPFKSVWTVHLLEDKGDWWPMVNRLRPLPIQHLETRLSEIKLPQTQKDYLEEVIRDGVRFLSFKPELLKEFLKKLRKMKFAEKQSNKGL